MSEDREETIIRGGQAQVELGMTEEAFAGLRAAMLEKIATSAFSAQAERERLYMGIQSLDAVRKMLKMMVAAGDHAELMANLQAEFTSPT